MEPRTFTNGAVEAQNGATEVYNGGVEAQNGAVEVLQTNGAADSHHFDESRIRIRIIKFERLKKRDPKRSAKSDADPQLWLCLPDLCQTAGYIFKAVLRIRIRDPVPF